MTIKATKELLTGDTATLLSRLLIILALSWNGVNQVTTKDNTEDIKATLAGQKEKVHALEQRVSRNEFLDGSDHSRLQIQVDQSRKDFQDFKETYYKSQNF